MEVTRDQYAEMETLAHQLHDLIYNSMDGLKDERGRLTTHWHELHELMLLAGVIGDAAGRYRDRAELPADPIDLTITPRGGAADLAELYESLKGKPW